jgi:hypothetical protein
MAAHRLDDFADGIENGVGGVEAARDVAEEVGEAPARGLGRAGVADPTQHLLGAVGFGGGEAAGLEFFERLALGLGQCLRAFQRGPTGGLGQLASAGPRRGAPDPRRR